MRLTGKGYRVLVLERGKRYRDEDFPRSNWNVFKYLWFPALRCFGIQNLTLLKDVLVLHGTGVGGGSLVYANVLMEPDDVMFEAPAWRHLADWKQVLRPHYDTARRMLGVTTNPRLWPADNVLREVAEEMGRGETFCPAELAITFAEPGREGEPIPDPYFGGEGPTRNGCTYCGLHGRLPLQRQEHARQELPLLRGEVGRGGARRDGSHRHPSTGGRAA